MKKRLRNSIIILLLAFPCAEIAARIVGWAPLVNENFSVTASPNHWLIGDSICGLKLNPGEYEITLENAITFKTTHTERGVRRNPANGDKSREVHVFGCSFTYGYGVNDAEVFTNLLQEKHDELSVINFGVPGYGTAQSILQLKEEMGEGSFPTHAILVYSEVHPERNALANSYRRALKIGYSRSNSEVDVSMKNARFPFKTVSSSEIQYAAWEAVYSNWAGRETFAVVHALQSTLEKEMEQEEMTTVTADLFAAFITLCVSNQIVPVIVNLDEAEFHTRYKEILERSKVKVIDVGFDFTDKALTNLPYDSHPNAAGHAMIASKMERGLRMLLNE